MKVKNTAPYKFIEKSEAPDYIKIYFLFNQLKLLYRQGWLRFVPASKCESVAEHTLGVLLLGFMLYKEYLDDVNVEKLAKMILIHDFGEIIVGDLRTTINNDNPHNKHERELDAIREIFQSYPGGEEYIDLWKEVEEKKTKEAQFVGKIDKIEMILQAAVYEHTYEKKLQEFFDYTMNKYGDTDIRKAIEEVDAIRPSKKDPAKK